MENIDESFLGDLIINHTPTNDLLKAAGRVPKKKGFNDEQTLETFLVKSKLPKKKNNFALIAVAAVALLLIFKK